jgi:hypothetical protein
MEAPYHRDIQRDHTFVPTSDIKPGASPPWSYWTAPPAVRGGIVVFVSTQNSKGILVRAALHFLTFWISRLESGRYLKRRRRGNTVSDETVMYSSWTSVTWPVSDYTVSYRPAFSSERAPYIKSNKAIVTKERIRIKSWHRSQRGSPIPRWTDWLTVGRKINSTHSDFSASKCNFSESE